MNIFRKDEEVMMLRFLSITKATWLNLVLGYYSHICKENLLIEGVMVCFDAYTLFFAQGHALFIFSESGDVDGSIT